MRTIVLAVERYSFEAEGKNIRGCKITYTDGFKNDTDNLRGMTPVKATADEEVFLMCKKVPGIYDLGFTQRPDRAGKPVLTIRTATLVKEIDINMESPTVQNLSK